MWPRGQCPAELPAQSIGGAGDHGDPLLFIHGRSSLLDHAGCRHETPHSDSYIFRKDPFVYHEPAIQALSVSVSGFTVLA